MLSRLDRFASGSKWPSLRIALCGALGLGLLTLIASIWVSSRLPMPPSTRPREHLELADDCLQRMPITGAPLVIVLLIWAVTTGMPLVAAIVAGCFTASRAHDLPMRPLDYVLASLYRLRFLLALVVGLTPALVFWKAYNILMWIYMFNDECMDGCFWPLFCPEPNWVKTWLSTLCVYAAMEIARWGTNLLAAALSVTLTLRWWLVGAVLAAIVIIAIIVLPIVPAWGTEHPFALFTCWPLEMMAVLPVVFPNCSGATYLLPCVLWLGVALYAVLPYALGLLVIRVGGWRLSTRAGDLPSSGG